MTNHEARMTKEARMSNPEINADHIHSVFGFRHSFVIRASSFVIPQKNWNDSRTKYLLLSGLVSEIIRQFHAQQGNAS